MILRSLQHAMQQAGIRRLAVISGDAVWSVAEAARWRDALPGDWLTVSDENLSDAPHCAPGALRTLLGREFTHALFDARDGFHAEAFAALAGTLRAGSWLLVLVPCWRAWPQQPDSDSLRWADVSQAIATPNFIHRLQASLLADEQIVIHQKHLPIRYAALPPLPAWQCQAAMQQQVILQQLHAMDPGVAVLTAARGRGKSALAGMLAQQNTRCLVTAPAKVATAVLETFAHPHFHFMAPDALLASREPLEYDWLIIDEAAAIPAPLLHQLAERFPRTLLTTTVQGYEGTGRGFMLKFCAELSQVTHFTLDEPLRWSRHDPLEKWLEQVLLFQDAPAVMPDGHPPIMYFTPADWPKSFQPLAAAYRLLASAHYRTSPIDLRRMMDAPGMHFWLAGEQAALWLVDEGGLSAELAQAVWAGTRRPRGNLVAQSLAAHAGFAEAATLYSQRISRIAVAAACRRQGWGKKLVDAAKQATSCDYLSVSFGYTPALWAFWRSCGFTLARIGSQREASSGCYAAMAILPLTAAGKALQRAASERLARDWPVLRQNIALDVQIELHDTRAFSENDSELAAGFAWAQRPWEASLPVLHRLVEQSTLALPLLRAAVVQNSSLTSLATHHRLTGRKAMIAALRDEAAQALIAWDTNRAQYWQKRLQPLQ